MTRRTLIYRWDDQAGQMRLRGAGIRLQRGDRKLLETALVRRYESLIAELERGGTEPTILFDTTVAQPRRIRGFRVRWGGDSRSRCPELALEPIPVAKRKSSPPRRSRRRDAEPERPATTVQGALMVRAAAEPRELAVAGNTPWVAEFMADIKQRMTKMGPARMSNADKAGMMFALTQLRGLCEKRPEDLAVVLLAGYVSLGERISDTTRPEEAHLYRLAARVLDQWCGPETPATAGAASKSNDSQPETPTSRLWRITQFLGRVLGLQDDEDSL